MPSSRQLPTLSDVQTGPLVDRRGFLTAAGVSAISAMLLSACGGGGDGSSGLGPGPTPSPPPGGSNLPPSAVQRIGNTLRIDVAQVPALQQSDGFLILNDPASIMVNTNGSYVAFTAVCTHSGCLVGNYANGRITCPCHGSQFNLQGQVVNGPAPSPLRSFPTRFEAASRILTVTLT